MEKIWIVAGEFKEITSEEFDELSKEDQGLYYKAVSDRNADQRKEMQDEIVKLKKADGENADEISELALKINELDFSKIESLEKAMREQGTVLEKLQDGISNSVGEKDKLKQFIADNADELVKIQKAGTGMIEYKAVGSMESSSATYPSPAPDITGVQQAPATNINLKLPFIDELITIFDTELAAYPYTYSEPKDGDYSFVLEKGSKPQIDFIIKTEFATPVKIAAHIVLTDESVKDIKGLQSIATDYLKKKHDLKRQNGILFGDGINPNPRGATDYGRAFVPGDMADKFSLGETTIIDVINACVTDICTTHNFVDEIPYIANLTLMNKVDFFLELVSAKDADGHPLYPQASLFNRVVIGGVLIIPEESIPAGKLFVADLELYNVTRYEPYTVKIGFINDQFITNQFTMVGESRFHAFVKKLDEQAFIFDDIATIKLGLETA